MTEGARAGRAQEDALEALFARQPSRMVPDVDRIRDLVDLLGQPQAGFPSVHVTGTNGKTTTTAMVAALLTALGLTAGSYTSPSLQDVRERIRVAGRPIARGALRKLLAYLQPFLAEVDGRHPERLSFFEVLTAAAFVHFSDAPVDAGVIEVGMGGRWDATNVVDAPVAVLLRVGVDHRELGADPVTVAHEKVGIVKPGAAVVAAEQAEGPLAVIQEATAEAGGRLLLAGRDFGWSDRVPAVGGQSLTLRGVTGTVQEVYVPLFGEHQAANAAVALAAVEGFLGFAGGLDPDVVREGFAAVRSPGRCEVVLGPSNEATLVLDGAHNPDGAASIAATLAEEFTYRHRVVVLGVLDDKDVEAMVAALAPVVDHVVATRAPSDRAADPERIAAAARDQGLSVEQAPNVAEAIERARGVATAVDAILVTGSLTTVGAARDALGLPVA